MKENEDYPNEKIKFSDWNKTLPDDINAGDGYESLSELSKKCIDAAVERYLKFIQIQKSITTMKEEDGPHEASKVKCDLCSYEWIAVRPEGLIKLECPNCENMVHFENISQ